MDTTTSPATGREGCTASAGNNGNGCRDTEKQRDETFMQELTGALFNERFQHIMATMQRHAVVFDGEGEPAADEFTKQLENTLEDLGYDLRTGDLRTAGPNEPGLCSSFDANREGLDQMAAASIPRAKSSHSKHNVSDSCDLTSFAAELGFTDLTEGQRLALETGPRYAEELFAEMQEALNKQSATGSVTTEGVEDREECLQQ